MAHILIRFSYKRLWGFSLFACPFASYCTEERMQNLTFAVALVLDRSVYLSCSTKVTISSPDVSSLSLWELNLSIAESHKILWACQIPHVWFGLNWHRHSPTLWSLKQLRFASAILGSREEVVSLAVWFVDSLGILREFRHQNCWNRALTCGGTTSLSSLN